ncbi:hypothetical protein BHM03_00057485 [Ensete ventricosum]|nr:hypothetical protein BHM03_00057485 [Ensete ventricosum]
MKADKKIKVKRLDPDQAWELFQRNASKDVIRSDAGINPLAKQVADECAGLPLALITAGQAMSTKKTWEAWNDALTLMRHAKTPEIAEPADDEQKEVKMHEVYRDMALQMASDCGVKQTQMDHKSRRWLESDA